MRILHLTVAPELGGLQRVLCSLARDQLGRGLFVKAATSPGGELGARLRALGVEVLETPMESGLDPRSVLRILRTMVRDEIDVVHAHGARATQYAYFASRASRRTATVSHVHLADPWRFSGSLRARLDRYASRRFDRVVACSRQLREQLVERQGFDPANTIAIPNGIDTDRFMPCTRPSTGLTIGTCARLEHQKGLEYLLEAIARLEEQLGPLRLSIAGKGSLEAALKARAEELGIARHVEWLGLRDDVPQVLSTFHVFVLPSLAEGLPLALLEAMAAGVPVVATDIPGNNEVLADRRHGLLVPPRDPVALANAIRSVVSDPDGAARRAEAAQAHVVRNHSLAAMTASFSSLYGELAVRTTRT